LTFGAPPEAFLSPSSVLSGTIGVPLVCRALSAALILVCDGRRFVRDRTEDADEFDRSLLLEGGLGVVSGAS
jgi:hypothetical protein